VVFRVYLGARMNYSEFVGSGISSSERGNPLSGWVWTELSCF
jgi:hypothetical protein